MNFLTNFTETFQSDNRFRFIKEESYKEIIIGSNCTHIFELDLLCGVALERIEILYRQNLHKTFTFSCAVPSDNESIEIIEDPLLAKSYVVLKLTSQDTIAFEETLLDTQAQLKLVLKNGDITYTNIELVKVIKPITPIVFKDNENE